jgi:hypothetical protein
VFIIIKLLDNVIVTPASNTDTHLPEQTAIRRVGRNMEHVPQPIIVVKYNPSGKNLKKFKSSPQNNGKSAAFLKQMLCRTSMYSKYLSKYN